MTASSKYAGKAGSLMEQEFRARADAQPCVFACAWCPDLPSFVGTVAECREQAAAHRAKVHPQARGRRRYGSSLRVVDRVKADAARVRGAAGRAA